MKVSYRTRFFLILCLTLFATPAAWADYVFIGIPAANWGASDTFLGVAGMTIEDFEDTTLASGLRIQSTGSSLGTYGPTNTLPNVFNPVANDPNGNAFETGVWDGNHVLVNTGTNLSGSYGTGSVWADLTFYFDGAGARTVGFSLQQMQSAARVIINGTDVGALLTLTGLSSSSGRVGYVRIEVTGDSAPISTLKIDNGSGDGFIVDHLAFSSAAANTYTVSGFAAAQWGNHTALGVSGYVEDFEDLELLPGLQAQVTNSLLGTYGPTNTLPNTFAPVTQDNFGSAYNAGIWDGSNVLVNTGTNRTGSYGTAGNWGDITLHFEGTEYVGFSVENMQTDATLLINGSYQGKLLQKAGLSTSNGRNGYVLIEAPEGVPITSVTIDNASGDGLVIDHLAFSLPTSVQTATVAGHIELEESANPAQQVTLEFRVAVRTPFLTHTITLDSNGNFSLPNIPRLKYTLHIKGAKWLAQNVVVDARSGDVSNVNALLRAADADNNNIIDVADLAELIESFDANPASPNWNGGAADFDCNNIVDVADLSLLIINFDRVGDA